VLLLDEVLAVGDAAFRIKCYRRISQMRKKAALIFVSHDTAQVARMCDRTLVLTHGYVHFDGEPSSGIEAYHSLNDDDRARADSSFVSYFPPLTCFEVESIPSEITCGAPFTVVLMFDSQAHLANVVLRIAIYNMAGDFAADCLAENRTGIGPGKTRSRIELSSLPLKAGRYHVSISIADAAGEFLAFSNKAHEIRVTGGHPGTVADCQLTIRSWATIEGHKERKESLQNYI
jgi:lipopolysaccharide transport system ATP-binding protein